MKKSAYILLATLMLLSSCTTVGDIKPGQGSSFEVSDRNYNDIWRASVEVVSRNLTILESDKALGIVKAEKRAGATTWGELIGVFIVPPKTDAKQYTVEVVSKKRLMTQLTGQDWTATIVAGIKAELGM